MILLSDRDALGRAPDLDLSPRLHELLRDRIAALGSELLATTTIVLVGPGDSERDIVLALGYSPLVEPFDGIRYGEPGFHPGGFDFIADHGGAFEISISFGSSAADLILVEDADGVDAALLDLCKEFSKLGLNRVPPHLRCCLPRMRRTGRSAHNVSHTPIESPV